MDYDFGGIYYGRMSKKPKLPGIASAKSKKPVSVCNNMCLFVVGKTSKQHGYAGHFDISDSLFFDPLNVPVTDNYRLEHYQKNIEKIFRKINFIIIHP